MIDQHTLAILCRGIADGDGQYLSIGMSCSWAEALEATHIIGTELGYGPLTSCRYYPKNDSIHVNYHLDTQRHDVGKQTYISLTIKHGTETLAKQLERIIRGSLCIRCNTYIGRDCHDHGVTAHCADCAEHLDIGEPESRGRSYFDNDPSPIDLELV